MLTDSIHASLKMFPLHTASHQTVETTLSINQSVHHIWRHLLNFPFPIWLSFFCQLFGMVGNWPGLLERERERREEGSLPCRVQLLSRGTTRGRRNQTRPFTMSSCFCLPLLHLLRPPQAGHSQQAYRLT